MDHPTPAITEAGLSLPRTRPVSAAPRGSRLLDRHDINMVTFVPGSRDVLHRLAEPRAGWFLAADATGGVTPAARTGTSRAGSSNEQLIVSTGFGTLRPNASRTSSRPVYGQAPMRSPVTTRRSPCTASATRCPASIHITVPWRLRKERRGVIAHVAAIADREIEARDYVAITTIERTINDVARSSTPNEIDALIDEAEHGGLLRHNLTTSLRVSLVGLR